MLFRGRSVEGPALFCFTLLMVSPIHDYLKSSRTHAEAFFGIFLGTTSFAFPFPFTLDDPVGGVEISFDRSGYRPALLESESDVLARLLEDIDASSDG